MVKDLRIDIDTVQAFVPGVRRGYAIMPQGPREGEDQQQMRERLSAALRRVRQANIQTGAHDALDAAFAVAREAEAGATRRNVQAPLPDVGGNVGASGDRMADGDGVASGDTHLLSHHWQALGSRRCGSRLDQPQSHWPGAVADKQGGGR